MSLIEKGAQPAPSFEEQMRAAEEAAGIPSDEVLYGEQFEQPPRDEDGRFARTRPPEEVSAEQAVPADAGITPEAESTPLEPITDADPGDETDYAAKFEEVNKKLGQLINENAELRRAQEQRYAEPEPVQQQPYVPAGWFDNMVEQNPQQAAEWAKQNGQPILYEQAIRAWGEYDPFGALRYDQNRGQEMLVQNLSQTIAPQLQATQVLAAERGIEQAMQAVASRHPDFADVMGTLTPEGVDQIMNSGLPSGILAQALQGSQQEKEQVFETVYRWQKADMADTFAQAAQATDQQVKDEAREEKLEAFVGSATTTVPDQAPETEAERQARAWAELRPSMSSAWTGRDSRQRLGR